MCDGCFEAFLFLLNLTCGLLSQFLLTAFFTLCRSCFPIFFFACLLMFLLKTGHFRYLHQYFRLYIQLIDIVCCNWVQVFLYPHLWFVTVICMVIRCLVTGSIILLKLSPHCCSLGRYSPVILRWQWYWCGSFFSFPDHI